MMILAAVSFYLRVFRLSGTASLIRLDCIPPYVDILESIPSHLLLLNITERFDENPYKYVEPPTNKKQHDKSI
jgi:hypothetical protein